MIRLVNILFGILLSISCFSNANICSGLIFNRYTSKDYYRFNQEIKLSPIIGIQVNNLRCQDLYFSGIIELYKIKGSTDLNFQSAGSNSTESIDVNSTYLNLVLFPAKIENNNFRVLFGLNISKSIITNNIGWDSNNSMGFGSGQESKMIKHPIFGLNTQIEFKHKYYILFYRYKKGISAALSQNNFYRGNSHTIGITFTLGRR